jgi:UDP-N-acetylglucosamine 2-epimerase
MSDVFFEELGLRAPELFLGVGSGSKAEQVARVMVAFEPLLDELRPDVVVVVGDVNSTVACALVAAKAGALVAHVEAGLRSRDWAMPEEVNRVVTDRVSDYLLAPSPDQEDTNQLVGCDPQRIVAAARAVLRNGVPHRCPALWDGKAGERVAQVLLDGGGPSGHLRPTDVPAPSQARA